MTNKSVMIVAGESSGDAHAAALVAALGDEESKLSFFGATGPKMRAAGVETVAATDQLSITGLLEIGGALPRFWKVYRALVRASLTRRPAAVILVDWPDFNLRLARKLHGRGTKIIYYISPQLWAWRSHRVRNIRRDVDLLLSILPFEAQWYRQRGVKHVAYVGHPLSGKVRAHKSRAEFCRAHDLDAARPIVALLPGSRRKELARILPPMIEAAVSLHAARPSIQFALALAPSRNITEARVVIETANAQTLLSAGALRIIEHETREALGAADAAAVASGTATLEAAIIGTPLVIVYKESAFNWHTLGRLITTEHYGLINLIAGERLAAELMQDEFTAESLAGELIRLLEPETNRRMRTELRAATDTLGTADNSRTAAREILSFLSSE